MNKEIDLQNCIIDMRNRQRGAEERERVIRRDSRLGRSLHSRINVRHKTEETIKPRSSVSSSSSPSEEEDVSFDIPLSEFLTQDEIYMMEGHLNRVENRARSKLSKI
jgi:hypothetical protein